MCQIKKGGLQGRLRVSPTPAFHVFVPPYSDVFFPTPLLFCTPISFRMGISQQPIRLEAFSLVVIVAMKLISSTPTYSVKESANPPFIRQVRVMLLICSEKGWRIEVIIQDFCGSNPLIFCHEFF